MPSQATHVPMNRRGVAYRQLQASNPPFIGATARSDAPHSQPRRRKKATMPTRITTMVAITIQNPAGVS